LARLDDTFLEARAKMMAVRTVAIDDALRAVAVSQVVILGAGLDGRAWRMPELHDALVFEVDHPDSQREKKARTQALHRLAREVRFIPLDFARQDLDQALHAAGHDTTQPTAWIWEGVVMYLERSEIEATLSVIARRSSPASRLIIAYMSPAPIAHLVGPILRLVGEPLKSFFTPDQLRDLLRSPGFDVVADDSVATLGGAFSPALGRATRPMRHLRIAVADRSV
jgi:methyltransferase (TIGR00027 family)